MLLFGNIEPSIAFWAHMSHVRHWEGSFLTAVTTMNIYAVQRLCASDNLDRLSALILEQRSKKLLHIPNVNRQFKVSSCASRYLSIHSLDHALKTLHAA